MLKANFAYGKKKEKFQIKQRKNKRSVKAIITFLIFAAQKNKFLRIRLKLTFDLIFNWNRVFKKVSFNKAFKYLVIA